jgi:hypothetical protein
LVDGWVVEVKTGASSPFNPASQSGSAIHPTNNYRLRKQCTTPYNTTTPHCAVVFTPRLRMQCKACSKAALLPVRSRILCMSLRPLASVFRRNLDIGQHTHSRLRASKPISHTEIREGRQFATGVTVDDERHVV